MNKSKVLVIGLGPEYNYIKENHSIWMSDNTKYASNHGASLISRTLLEFFNADYVDDFSKVEEYKKQYDLCVVAFATHITERRDVSRYTNFIKKLNIKTIAFSLGIQDYSQSSSIVNKLHSSIIELIDYVIKSSGYCGVRGPYTASLLVKSGFKSENIIHLGCPTLFKPLNRNLTINKPHTFEKPLVVYHRTLADINKNLIENVPILGQDFLDEVIFNNTVENTHELKKVELEYYKSHKNGSYALQQVDKNGVFVNTFDEWFKIVGEHDFVYGPRLHGCVAALIQGIPAVMVARDQRVVEIAEFYKIPYVKYENIGDLTAKEIYNNADFTEFNKLYSKRFDNFIKLMHDLKVLDKLSFKSKIPDSYFFTKSDLGSNTNILFNDIKRLNERCDELETITTKKIDNLELRIDTIFSKLNKIPGYKLIKKIFA